MTRENRIGSGLISNMALSGICKPASMIMGYLYVPIVLSFLGTEKYGRSEERRVGKECRL